MTKSTLKKMEPFFASRYKLPVHLVQIVLVIIVIALSGARVLMKNTPKGRSTTMGLGMGAKSLAIILYQLFTEQFDRLRRWGSLKAYTILNSLEIVFWGAVAFMSLQANTKTCIRTSCALGWVVLALSIMMSMLAKYMAVICYLDWRYFRANGIYRHAKLEQEGSGAQSLESVDIRSGRK